MCHATHSKAEDPGVAQGRQIPADPATSEVTQHCSLRFIGCDKALRQHSHMMLVFSLVELGAGFGSVTPHSFGSVLI